MNEYSEELMAEWESQIPPEDERRKLLFEAICWAKQKLPRVEPEYCIVYERPPNMKNPGTSVCTPAPEWMAMAMHGGLLPHIDVYHSLRTEWTHNETGEKILMRINESPGPEWGKAKVTNGWLLHYGPRADAMTQEEAMEYLLEKDVPFNVWYDHKTANRARFAIVPRAAIPKDRTWRNIWEFNPDCLPTTE